MFMPVPETFEFYVIATEFSETKPSFITSTFLKQDIVLLNNSSNWKLSHTFHA